MCGHFEPMNAPPRRKAPAATAQRVERLRPLPAVTDRDATAHERAAPVDIPH